MEAIVKNLFESPIISRLPAWVITVAFIMVILKYTGAWERWAKFVADILAFVREREAIEAERERWAAQREAEIEEIHTNAAVQAQAAKQLSDQRAQQQLYVMLERSIQFLQTDFMSKLTDLTESHIVLSHDINEMKIVAAKTKESLMISHGRMDSLIALVPQISQNFDELKPYLLRISKDSVNIQTNVKELEKAIELLVEKISKGV